MDLKKTDLFVEGDYHLWNTHDDFYVYERVMDKQVGLVICNVTDQPKEFVLHQLDPHGYRQILLQNGGNRLEGETLHLGPYGVAVFQTVYNS